MNIFENKEIAQQYDSYYQTELGKKIDILEKNLIKSLLCLPNQGSTFLEVGCGTGHWTAYFSELGYDITAVDISDAMLEIAQIKKIKRTKFVKADVQNLPFHNEQFDVVASITMLEFVNNIESAINEMFRVLKHDGWLILGCLNLHSPLGKNKANDPTFKDAHFFTKEELYSLLSIWGEPIIKETVYFDEFFRLKEQGEEGAFLGVAIQKTKML
ncbi:MAG: class I SAM-dependent methyltransferase [Bacteroidales bacterium]|nr:class I SAM-dependent methyltransferase [Bacteroidales bacterium]